MTCDFTTSTPTDHISVCSHGFSETPLEERHEVYMWDALTELAGRTADWVALLLKAEILCQFYDLKRWTSELFPVLDPLCKLPKVLLALDYVRASAIFVEHRACGHPV